MCFLLFKIIFSQSCWFHICWMHEAFTLYSLRNLHISSLGCLYMLYFKLIRSKLEHSTVVVNSILFNDASKLKHIQQKCGSVSIVPPPPHVPYNYTVALEKLVYSLYVTGDFTFTHFFVQIYRGLKSCTSLLENVSLRVPPNNLRDFHCLVFVPLINTVLLLGAPMLPTRWVKISTYLQWGRLISTVFYNILPKIVNNIFS
jgi:hypothetical protein